MAASDELLHAPSSPPEEWVLLRPLNEFRVSIMNPVEDSRYILGLQQMVI